MKLIKKRIHFFSILVVIWFGIAVHGNAESNQYYYEQLNDIEKTIYNQIVEQVTVENRVITIEWPEKIQFETVTKQDADLEEKKQQNSQEVKQRIQNVLDALMQDRPEFFWMDIGATTEKWAFQGSGIIGNIVWTMMPIELSIGTNYTPEQVQEVQMRLQGIDIPGETRLQKLDVIHRYLCDLIEYDASTPYAHEPYGALVEGKAVCEGYARSFKWICEREGIPAILVIGDAVDNSGNTEAHMWNYVQMENGAWYAVDVTWDDQVQVMDEYFLVGENTKAVHFGGSTFQESHIPYGDFSGSEYKIFEYPPLSAEAYDPNAPVVQTQETLPKNEASSLPIQKEEVVETKRTQAEQLLQTVESLIDKGQETAVLLFDAILSSEIIYQAQTWIWFFIGVFLTVLFMVKKEMKK